MSVTSNLPNGNLFRYEHSDDEPNETWVMAVRVACTVAQDEAMKTGKSHVVARTIKPKSCNVFVFDSAALTTDSMIPVYEITPDSRCIRLEQ